jgi:hypothetical protein
MTVPTNYEQILSTGPGSLLGRSIRSMRGRKLRYGAFDDFVHSDTADDESAGAADQPTGAAHAANTANTANTTYLTLAASSGDGRTHL